jgi:hypothetical protein
MSQSLQTKQRSTVPNYLTTDRVFVDGDADWSDIGGRNTSYEEGIWLEDVVADMSVNMTAILVGDVNGSYVG